MTSYDVVYKRFKNKITDFNLPELDDYTRNEMMLEFLKSSISKTRTFSDLSKRDDEIEEFNNDLRDVDIELLADGMSLAWLDQYLNSTELVQQFVGGKEEKYYSQAHHISELRERRKDIIVEMHQLYTYNTYINNAYFS